MLLLQANRISKSIGATPLLTDISLQIEDRDRIGLVGVNGAGKSTLLQVLAGEASYDGGELFKAKDVRIGYLAQNAMLDSDCSIQEEMRQVFARFDEVEQELRRLETDMADPKITAEPAKYESVLNQYARLSDWFRDNGGFAVETKIKSVLHGMGFGNMAPDTRIRTLSGGQKTRLALAKLLLQEPDLLLLDEPTNHLDITTLTWLENYLRNYAGAIVAVSHDRYFLDTLATTIIEIERTKATRYTGNYSKFLELKEAERERQWKAYEQQQEEISRMEDFIQKNLARASTTGRAQSRRKMLERMERLDRPGGDNKRAVIRFNIERQTGKDVLRAEGISVAYEGGSPLFQPISLHLRRGEAVALIGPNGIGKTTLLRSLMGDLPLVSGSVEWGAGVKLGYYDQEQGDLNPANTVLDEVWNAYPHMEEGDIRTVLGHFLFEGEDVKKKISALSGGEKARVSLAKLMLLEANVLVLDEPTNHLDLYGKEALESALMAFEGTLLFISHDRYFLNRMAERIVELSTSGAEYFLGNYDDYADKKEELAEWKKEEETGTTATSRNSGSQSGGTGGQPSSAQADYLAAKEARREERARQRKMARLEDRITELEQQAAELEAEMARPEVYQDYVKLQDVQAALDQTKTELDSALVEWTEMAEQ